jgi:hypothetical protein
MGWALDNFSQDARLRIARSLFRANDREDVVNGQVWINGLFGSMAYAPSMTIPNNLLDIM